MLSRIIVLFSAGIVYAFMGIALLSPENKDNPWLVFTCLGVSIAILILPTRSQHLTRLSLSVTYVLVFSGVLVFFDRSVLAEVFVPILTGYALAKLMDWHELIAALSIGLAAVLITAVALQKPITAEAALPLVWAAGAVGVALLVRAAGLVVKILLALPLLVAAIWLSLNWQLLGGFGAVLVFYMALVALVRTWFFAVDREIDRWGTPLPQRLLTVLPLALSVFLLASPATIGVVLIFTMVNIKTRFCRQMI